MRSFPAGKRSVASDLRGAHYMVSINALSQAEFQKLTQLKAEKKRTKKHISADT